MNMIKTLTCVALVAGGTIVAKAQPPLDAETIRDCARTACSDFRSCSTAVPSALVQKSGQNTQNGVSDCRQGIADAYESCVGQVPQRIMKPNAPTNSHKKNAAITTPKTGTLRTENTTPKR